MRSRTTVDCAIYLRRAVRRTQPQPGTAHGRMWILPGSELQAYQALRQTMSLAPVEEPSPNFLAQSRVRLDDALDLLPPPSLWMRFEIGWQGFLAQLHAAPGMAMAVAVVGLGNWRFGWTLLEAFDCASPSRAARRFGSQRRRKAAALPRFITSAKLCSTRIPTWWRSTSTPWCPPQSKDRSTTPRCRSCC